jgi:HAD superfamily hydrolase (TIGR01549 family)
MIRAVLIDLDDTLLVNKMDIFLPAYFQKLGEYLADRIDPDQMLTELLNGTQQMLTNLDPTCTLERAFADHFYPVLGFDEQPLRDHIEVFYREIFPTLKTLTAERPEAKTFVNHLSEEGVDLVVATNPLFPRLAVEERLRWAGFTSEFPFDLIAAYEQFHFTKPHLEYYTEILGRLGLGPQDAVMLGDDPANDLAPAQSLGMGSFHLSQAPSEAHDGGDFEAASLWIEEDRSHSYRENAKSPAAILARARGHLAAMLTLLGELPEEHWSVTPIQGEWSLGEILCHLRDVEREVHLYRLNRMLMEEDAHLAGADTDAWAVERQYDCQPGQEAFSNFIQSRLELIERLTGLAHEDWERRALHTLLGPMRLNEVMAIANDHDTIHMAQLRETIAALPS